MRLESLGAYSCLNSNLTKIILLLVSNLTSKIMRVKKHNYKIKNTYISIGLHYRVELT